MVVGQDSGQGLTFFALGIAAGRIGGFARWADECVLRYVRREDLGCQALQNFFAQLLGLAEKFLIFHKEAIQFQGLVGCEFVA